MLQERGNYVTYGRGTQGEKRFWREGVKVTPAGKKGAESRADRPARPRLYMKPENAAGSRRPDFAKGSQETLGLHQYAQGARAKKEDAVMRSLVAELGRADREGPAPSVVQVRSSTKTASRVLRMNDTPGSSVRSMPIDAYKQRETRTHQSDR